MRFTALTIPAHDDFATVFGAMPERALCSALRANRMHVRGLVSAQPLCCTDLAASRLRYAVADVNAAVRAEAAGEPPR